MRVTCVPSVPPKNLVSRRCHFGYFPSCFLLEPLGIRAETKLPLQGSILQPPGPRLFCFCRPWDCSFPASLLCYTTHTHNSFTQTWTHSSLHATLSLTSLSRTWTHKLPHTQRFHTQTHKLPHTTLPRTTFHTQFFHTQIVTHNSFTHSLSHKTLLHTTLSHTAFHTRLFHIQHCHTQPFLVTHSTFTHNSFTHTHLSHIVLSHNLSSPSHFHTCFELVGRSWHVGLSGPLIWMLRSCKYTLTWGTYAVCTPAYAVWKVAYADAHVKKNAYTSAYASFLTANGAASCLQLSLRNLAYA